MSFVTGIPLDGQTLGVSKPLVRGNLDSLYNTFLVNHQDVNQSNPGTHTYVDLLVQASDSNPPTGQVAHYSKSVSGITEWFFQRENTGAVIQMSNGIPTNTGTFPNSTGLTFLPGGFQLQWGYITVNTLSPGTATFGFPAFPNSVLTGWTGTNAIGGAPPPTSIRTGSTSSASVYWGVASSQPYNLFWFILGN